ncbi:MAG: hypothetical protein GY856_45810 [bacterium]|nr:hypothetical protein [bacterium]
MSEKKASPAPVCGKHQVAKQWRLSTFVYTDNGISVCVPGVFGWVCPESGETSFPPETADELISTVRDLKAAAERSRKRRTALTQYVISVGQPEAA